MLAKLYEYIIPQEYKQALSQVDEEVRGVLTIQVDLLIVNMAILIITGIFTIQQTGNAISSMLYLISCFLVMVFLNKIKIQISKHMKNAPKVID